VVEDVAVFRFDLATAGADAGDGCFVTHGPDDFIDAVDGLLDEAVAAEPGEVVPVPHLPLDIAHTCRAATGWGHGLHGAGVVGGEDAGDFPNVSTESALEGLNPGSAVAPAEAGDEVEFLLLRLLYGSHGHVVADGIDGHGFLTEDMLPGIHCGLEMHGAEAGRAGEQNDIDAAVEELLIGVDTDKLFIRLHIHAVGEFLGEAGDAAVDLLHIDICHGDDLAIVFRAEGLGGSASAATTTADEADAECFTRVGLLLRTQGGGGGKDGGALDELAAVQGRGHRGGVIAGWVGDLSWRS
jgi:hypothetical protein